VNVLSKRPRNIGGRDQNASWSLSTALTTLLYCSEGGPSFTTLLFCIQEFPVYFIHLMLQRRGLTVKGCVEGSAPGRWEGGTRTFSGPPLAWGAHRCCTAPRQPVRTGSNQEHL